MISEGYDDNPTEKYELWGNIITIWIIAFSWTSWRKSAAFCQYFYMFFLIQLKSKLALVVNQIQTITQSRSQEHKVISEFVAEYFFAPGLYDESVPIADEGISHARYKRSADKCAPCKGKPCHECIGGKVCCNEKQCRNKKDLKDRRGCKRKVKKH